jgi:aminoglycoside phosphotransferase (APT) family kinase protein
MEIDLFAILAALGLDSPASVEPVRGGADAAIWRVEQAGECYALRVLRPDQSDQARREVAAMTAAATGVVAVPRVVANEVWRDRPVLLLAWSRGRPLAEALLHDPADLPRLGALGVAFGRVQAAIHALPCPAVLQGRAPFWESWVPAEPELAACLERLPARPPVLLHLDYHPLNVLVEGEGVTAVLDWANAWCGDPRADLARTLSIIRLAPLPESVPGVAGRALRRVFEAGWRCGYGQAAGPIEGLAPFCWWAGAVMERDLAPRLGRPDLLWLTPAYLGRVRRWTARWRRMYVDTNVSIC